MSKAAKNSIFILIGLIVIVLGFTGKTLMDKKAVEEAKLAVEGERDSLNKTLKARVTDIKNLKNDLSVTQGEVAKMTKKFNESENRAKELMSEVDNISKEREKFKQRFEDISDERNSLLERVEKLVGDNKDLEKELQLALDRAEAAQVQKQVVQQTPETAEMTIPTPKGDEGHWANVLKDKASLEMKLTELEDELSKSSLEIVELSQAKTELEIEVDTLVHEKEDLERDITHKEGLINNLSLELARTKNDKKFISDRSKKLNDENANLRKQLKMLASTKGALEKSIVRLTKDKQKIENQLGQSETLIQSKIDEIWEIKESIDDSLKSAQGIPPSSDIELPPIVVSSDGPSVNFNSGMSVPGISGKVVSINEENNFIIVDVGENSGVRIGDKLSVYRDSKYLASLEVIQVRKDISAADIKDQWTKIEVGDIVQ